MTHTMDVIQQRERLRSQVEEFRTLIGANEGESTVDALHRYTAAVQLGCALKLEQRAKEIAEQPAIVPVPKVREVTVAALIGGATLLRQGVEETTGQQPTRYPCSPTCTHDDAATPGHPERVKKRSEAVGRFVDPNAPTFDPMVDLSPAEYHAYELGAEAMRAACWEAVQEQMRRMGWVASERAWREFKAAIEGAAP